MLTSQEVLRTGFDAAALKPSQVTISDASDLPFDLVTVDYEGNNHVPSPRVLRQLAAEVDVRFTVPVRATGFDPLGDDALFDSIPAAVGIVLVAGNPAYLSAAELEKPIAPRLSTALDRAPDAWIGTEGIERLALATGATQFELLSPTTANDLRALRAAGFDGELAVYAPTVIDDDNDLILDAVGGYVARRDPIRRRLPADAPTDRTAVGGIRELLLSACRDYVLVGDIDIIEDRITTLVNAGADHVVGYPARGLHEFGVRT